ncbi:MAG TPA: HlyD family efflux transporter periplasmic adaptor subunit [Hypericibacter adhaerens]|uniref:HlyD family secretion protein n=1 Tax=Hypericibacter adhaerens TaxID=2602016 RepID=UPI002C7FF936|nr:HlyD family efflux transporter periplasmic adaptor subunit [Hypericibacter adhaerens]HWA46132.1 HlyD family efflux transporter periplasmic adaptor subunit [Hypericibacter adhaerens]
MKRLILVAVLIGLAALAAAGGWRWWQQHQSRLPDYIASGNGRIEAQEVQVAAKYSGRIAEVLVQEGDLVAANQVLARMETTELEASFDKAGADAAQAEKAVASAQAVITQRQAELAFAKQQYDRAVSLAKTGDISREIVDQRRSLLDAARAALDGAQAQSETSQRAVDSAKAEMRRIQAQLDDSALKAPINGRIQHRLAEPGEVLAAGGRVLTLLDLTDVYMTIFLPTDQVGRVRIGSSARVVLDAVPEYVIPANISFIAAEAQFTPKQVETKDEREKLMFRVKVQIDPSLLKANEEKVKTGLPGEAYVLLAPDQPWPPSLEVKLPE